MQIRQIDAQYLDFLRAFDPHVPHKEERPWLYPVQIGQMRYAIPLTTQDAAFGYVGVFRCGSRPDRGLNLRYMIPVVNERAFLRERPLNLDLQAELDDYEQNLAYIVREANLIHALCTDRQMELGFIRHCCDFAKLEMASVAWEVGKSAGTFYEKEETNMAITKDRKLQYTKEQYNIAKQKSAIEYALEHGYESQLVRENSYYKMREHDSMVFKPNGDWFWNSRQIHGRALDFMIHYEGKSLPAAVLELAGDVDVEHPTKRQEAPQKTYQRPQHAPFTPPTWACDYRNLFGYLCDVRGLDKGVVQELVKQKRVFSTVHKTKYGKVLKNVAFAYKDSTGKIVGAYERGTCDRVGFPPYKRAIVGSDKSYGWLMESCVQPATELRVFEAAIDAASDASRDAIFKGDKWREQPIDRLSLEGLAIQPLETYLKQHPNCQKIILMLDADNAGRDGAQRIRDQLKREGYQGSISIWLPKGGKDWNAVLMNLRSEQMAQKAQEADVQTKSDDMEMEM